MTTKPMCNPEQIASHDWYQTTAGQQYCRRCGYMITKSGRWLPPHSGWNPPEPSPDDKPITSDMLNIGWIFPPAAPSGEDGGE